MSRAAKPAPRRAAFSIIMGFVFAAAGTAAWAAPGTAAAGAAKAAPAAKPIAVLERGAEARPGLPGFGPNALPCIYGEYRLEGAAGRVLVWASAEPLYLAPARWKRSSAGGRAVWESLDAQSAGAGAPGRLVLFEKPFDVEGQGAQPKRWSVLAFVPADSAAAADAFIGPFLDRFSYFLSSAKSPEEASFPALVDKRP